MKLIDLHESFWWDIQLISIQHAEFDSAVDPDTKFSQQHQNVYPTVFHTNILLVLHILLILSSNHSYIISCLNLVECDVAKEKFSKEKLKKNHATKLMGKLLTTVILSYPDIFNVQTYLWSISFSMVIYQLCVKYIYIYMPWKKQKHTTDF